MGRKFFPNFETASRDTRDPASKNGEEELQMKHRTVISIIVSAMLALTSMSIYGDQGKGGGKSGEQDQQMDRDHNHDKGHDKNQDKDKARDRDQDRQQTQDPMSTSDKEIYGSELMSPEERNQYREQFRLMDSDEERLQFQAQHREKMDARAKALELEVEEAE